MRQVGKWCQSGMEARQVNRFSIARLVSVSVAVGFLGAPFLCAQTVSERPQEPSSIRANVEGLAADALEGRLTGTDGIRRAADHIIGELKLLGAEPLPGVDHYRLPFRYTGSATDVGTTLRLEAGRELYWEDGGLVNALSFSDSGLR